MTKTDPNAKRSAGVEAGMLDGYPYLRNEQVTVLWSRGENGGGMLRVHDSISEKELLRIDESKATAWQVDVKKADGQRLSYTNAGVPCEVTVEADNGEGKLSFTWSLADLQVTVVARLKADESLARSQILAEVTGEGTGLMTVTHPLVSGILPMTEGAAADQILHTLARWVTWKKSPLLGRRPGRLRVSRWDRCSSQRSWEMGWVSTVPRKTARPIGSISTGHQMRNVRHVGSFHFAPGAQLGRGKNGARVSQSRRPGGGSVSRRLV